MDRDPGDIRGFPAGNLTADQREPTVADLLSGAALAAGDRIAGGRKWYGGQGPLIRRSQFFTCSAAAECSF